MKGTNLVDVQRSNRSLVIRMIQKMRRTSRSEIAKITGLNKATVTNIVAELISWGVVQETGLITGEAGRRSIALELAADNFTIIGLWVTRRHLRVGLYNMYGECKFRERYSIGLTSPIEELIDMICEKIRFLEKKKSSKRVLGVALALPGPYIKQEGKIAFLTERREWQNIDVVSRIQERIDLKLVSEHDADAATLAEWCFTENYNEHATLSCLLIGQGVGGGVIADGKLLQGRLGVAGEIGHMSIDFDGPPCECGNHGCLEKYCGTIALLKRMRELLPDYPDSVCTEEMTDSQLVDAYLEGDPLAARVVQEAAKYLSYGITNIIKIFNPDKVIIGDELSRAGEAFLENVKRSVNERMIHEMYKETQIVLSTLTDSVLCGACMALMQTAVENPEIYFTNV